MKGSSSPDDFIVIPDSKNKSNLNKNAQLHDSSRNKDIKELQEEIDRLKLQNYHLKDEIEQRNNKSGQSQTSQVQLLQSQNEQLKQALKRNSQISSSQIQDRYHKALKEISKLLKSNNQLRVDLQYVKGKQGKREHTNSLEEIQRYQNQVKYLEDQNKQLKYKASENKTKGKSDVEDELFQTQNRLKERQLDNQELQNLIQQSERKYISTNNHFQKLMQEAQEHYRQMEEDHQRKEGQLKEQLEDSEQRLRSNQRQLDSIKMKAGYFHSEVDELKDHIQKLEAVNEELRREANREESSLSQSSAVGELKAHINHLNSEVQNLRQYDLAKDTNQLLAENQMYSRQILNLSNRNSLIEKEIAELKIVNQELTRKFEANKTRYQTLTQANSQLEANYLKKQQRLNKILRDNQLLRQKMMHPGVRKAIADFQQPDDIDIEQLKIKVRNCILIFELLLNDPSQQLSPKQIEVEQLHNLKILLIEIDIKIKTLIEDNDSMKKTLNSNKQIIYELEDINGRLDVQSKSYEQLIQKLQQQFERSITRNQKIELNHTKQMQEQIQSIQQQRSIQIKYFKQEIQTKVLEYEVKLTTAKNNYKRSELSLHSAYQQKQEELTSQLRSIEKAHGEAIRQLRVLGPQKEQTIARLYSSVHDLELELKLYKNQNQIADRNIQQLKISMQAKDDSNQVLQNNIKVILSSQGEKIQELEDYKLMEKDYSMKLQNSNAMVNELTEKINALEAANIDMQSELQIAQEQAAELYHHNQNMVNQLNSRQHDFRVSKDQNFGQIFNLRKRVHNVSIQRQQLEELKFKQEKYHTSELTLFKKNYQQKIDLLERNYQQSVKNARILQEKVDDLTLINIQLYHQLKRHEDPTEDIGKRSFVNRIDENHRSFFVSSAQDRLYGQATNI